MKAEPTSKAAPPKIKNPFFGVKKKMDVKLNKAQKRAVTPIDLKKKPKKATKDKETKKTAIQSLQKPVKEIKSTSTKYQKHKDPEAVKKETQDAAILPAEKANKAVAHRSQVDTMESQTKNPEPKTFDKEKFSKNLKIEINNTISDKEEAKKVGREGVGQTTTKNIGQTLEDEKSEAGGRVEQSAIKSPELLKTPDEEITSQEPKALLKEAPEAKMLTAQKSALAPKKRPAEETDLTTETKVLDDEYNQNNLSQDKLQNSNEPKFIQADQQKQDSQTKAQELTDQTRKNEAKTIYNTQAGGIKAINGAYGGMLLTNSTIKGGSFDKQKEKSVEENKIRSDVSRDLDTMFNKTNNLVLAFFAAIDVYVEIIFGMNLTNNLDKFSRRVAQLLDDNTGILDVGLKVVKREKVLNEVQIFDKAKEEFMVDMEDPIKNLVDKVDTCLTAANNAIKEGKKEVDVYWSKQSKETKAIAEDILKDTESKFEELENTVENKEGEVIEKVTEKFSAALDEMDARFEKAKEENKSWLDRAIDAVKAVINTIIDLKNAIQAVARKAAKYAEQIIDDPITFFGNLSDGVGLGFTNFKNNIDKHLVKGVLEWLTGSMAGSEIILPKELNLEGITSLVLQILGISIKKIKGLVIDIIGKERFEFIEKGVDAGISAGNNILNMFKILNEKGLAGLWEFIKEEFSDLKEMLIENVKTFVVETITRKAVEFLLSLLIPGAGFIRAAQLLIKFVITLFQKAAQIVKIIDGILDSFGNILKKDIGGAAAIVENVLSGFLSLAISFLAAVLGLDGIVGKVQKFIQQKIRPKIDQVLKKIAQKIKEVITKIGLTKLIDKSMKVVGKGKAWVEDKKKKAIEKGKAGLGKLAEWLGLKKSYKSKDGNTHTLSFEESGKKPVMMRSSVKTTFDDYISSIRSKVPDYNRRNPTKPVKFKAIEDQYKLVRNAMGDYSNFDKNNVSGMMNKLAQLLSQLPDEFADLDVFFPNHSIISSTTKVTNYGGSNKSNDGNNIDVKNLSLKLGTLKGSPGKHTSKLFNHIHNKISVKGQLIRGHLLNHYLGGSGDTAENIMPIAKNTNDAMERSSDDVVKERLAKEKLLSGSVFDYAVSATYSKSTKLNAEVPSKITMSFVLKEYKSRKPKNKANMEDGNNWKPVATGQLKNRTLDAKTELENLI